MSWERLRDEIAEAIRVAVYVDEGRTEDAADAVLAVLVDRGLDAQVFSGLLDGVSVPVTPPEGLAADLRTVARTLDLSEPRGPWDAEIASLTRHADRLDGVSVEPADGNAK